jgi:hypothetical protein
MPKARLLPLLVALCATPCVVQAHHSHASLDPEDVRVLSGIVSKYSWSMPHVYLKVMAPNLQGETVEYSIEMLHPAAMTERGWSKESFKPGDRITWEGQHDRNKSRAYSDLVWAENNGARIGSESRQENQVIASTDFTGLWNRGPGQPTYFPPSGWPLTPVGQKQVDNFSEDQNPILTCGDPGPPKSMTLPYAHRITKTADNTLVIERDLMEGSRVVHLDGKPAIGAPRKLGYSWGWYEDGDLYVQSTGFTDDPWGNATGIDSSPQKEILEHFQLTDGGLGVTLEITVTDPVYLAEPVTFTHRWVRVPDRDLVQTPCTMESAQLWIEGGYE